MTNGLGVHERWLQEAIRLAAENAASGGGPFAALVVHEGKVIGQATNRTHLAPDPTAHAELLAVQEACRTLGRADLSDAVLYASGEPCPMCMGAIYWARLQAVYFACAKQEALEAVGFGDPLAGFYGEMLRSAGEQSLPITRLAVEQRLVPFYAWRNHHQGEDR